MADWTQRYYPGDEPGGGISLGTILFGLILLAIGVLWLLDLTGALDITWTIVGAVMLVLVGLALFVGAREGSHGGLVFLGIVLSVVVLFGSLATWPSFNTEVGERSIAPESVEAIEDEYEWGAGESTLDLRDVDFPEGETDVSIQLGAGEVVVYVPEDIGVRIDWQAGVGNVQIIGREQSGFGIDGSYETEGFADEPIRLFLDVQVGAGRIEVRQ